MLQLVYTSAPRLLEAGKTGFGTVARSRELPASLVAYLERLSSFDRSAGVSEYQFYSEYRMGGTRYRIFSRVADCGVDYTRRTNHIAHHLVTAEGDEEETRMAASTPAGVLQALAGAFLRTWTGNPTWLQPQELPAVLPLHGNGSWQQACGQPAYARWLANLPKSGCYLTTAKTYSAAQWAELLHEGFLTCPDHGWGMAFTTAKVSTLRSSDFLICCVDAAQTQAGVTLPGHTMALEIKPGMQAPPAPVAAPAAPPTAVASAPNPAPFVPRPAAPAAPLGAAPLPPQPGAPTSLPTGWNDGVQPSAPIPPQQPAEPAAERRSANMGMYVLGGCVVLSAAILYVGLSTKEQPPQPPSVQPQPAGQAQPTVTTAPAEQTEPTASAKETESEDNKETEQSTENKKQPEEQKKPKGGDAPGPENEEQAAEGTTTVAPPNEGDGGGDGNHANAQQGGDEAQPHDTSTSAPQETVPPADPATDSQPAPAPAPEPPVPTFMEKGLSVNLEPKDDKKFSVVLSCSVTKEEVIKTFRLTPNCHLYWKDDDSVELEQSRQITKAIQCKYPEDKVLERIKKKEKEKAALENDIKGYNAQIDQIEADSRSNVSANASAKFKKQKEESKKKAIDEQKENIKNAQNKLDACKNKLDSLKSEAEQAKTKATRAKQEQYGNAKVRITVSEKGPNVYIVGFEYVMPEKQ